MRWRASPGHRAPAGLQPPAHARDLVIGEGFYLLCFGRSLWVCDVSGGPFQLKATKSGKTPLGLEEPTGTAESRSAEFDEAAAELRRSLDFAKVPTREKAEVVAAFAHKQEVTAGYIGDNSDLERHQRNHCSSADCENRLEIQLSPGSDTNVTFRQLRGQNRTYELHCSTG